MTKAYDWLSRLSPAALHDPQDGLAGALDWLLATWTCERALGLWRSVPTSRSGAEQLAYRLTDLPRSRAFDQFFKCDAPRLALAHRVLRSHGVACLHLDAFIDGLAASLESVAPGTPDDLALFETRFALSGLSPRTPALYSPIHRSDLPSLLELLQADDQMMQGIVTRIGAATAFGTTRDPVDPDASEVLSTAISVWILHFARGYKLDRVSMLVRAHVYLGVGQASSTREAVRFLLAQQRPAGHFGFFGPEIARVRSKAPGWSEATGLLLPTTLACLWAICEWSNPGFRLMSSVA